MNNPHNFNFPNYSDFPFKEVYSHHPFTGSRKYVGCTLRGNRSKVSKGIRYLESKGWKLIDITEGTDYLSWDRARLYKIKKDPTVSYYWSWKTFKYEKQTNRT